MLDFLIDKCQIATVHRYVNRWQQHLFASNIKFLMFIMFLCNKKRSNLIYPEIVHKNCDF